MAQLQLILEYLDEAEHYGQKGIAADANSWRSHYILANVYGEMNQPQKQRRHYENALAAIDAALRLEPDNTELPLAREHIQEEC